MGNPPQQDLRGAAEAVNPGARGTEPGKGESQGGNSEACFPPGRRLGDRLRDEAPEPTGTHHPPVRAPEPSRLRLTRPLVVLDLETTGTWVEKDRIVEIAMVRLWPGGRQDRFESRVHPGMPIPPRVSQITGIGDEDVRDAPRFKEMAPKVLDFIGEADLAGFNIERFDLVILERELFEAGHKFEWRKRALYDAQRIYHRHEKRDLKAAYGFYCGKLLLNGHTAMGDTEATLEILGAQVERYGDPQQGIESLRDVAAERMDDYFDEDKKFRWWNGELYPVFGKYARKSPLKEIAAKDRSYLEWLLTTDFSPTIKEMLRGALAGRFPSPPAPPVGA